MPHYRRVEHLITIKRVNCVDLHIAARHKSRDPTLHRDAADSSAPRRLVRELRLRPERLLPQHLTDCRLASLLVREAGAVAHTAARHARLAAVNPRGALVPLRGQSDDSKSDSQEEL